MLTKMRGEKKELNKKNKFLLNIISSYSSQIINLICAFIVPKLILSEYGSVVNGLVVSIQQFLIAFTLLSAGVGTVVQSSLYKPLAEKDNTQLSMILVSAQKFFSKLGIGLVIYTFILCFVYPLFSDSSFSNQYIILLVLSLSIDTIAQYLFGATRLQLVTADQRTYISKFCNIFTRLLNTAAVIVLIKCHASIQVVKFSTALIFLIDPIWLAYYVRKNYSVNWKVKLHGEPIKQKWNGLAQHICTAIFSDTDVVVLTVLSNLKNVSVYSIYCIVLNGLNQLVNIFASIVQPLLGEYWAKKEVGLFKKYFSIYEWVMHLIAQFVFGCSMTLIVPFVLTYTKGVNDANYNVPVFALLITLSGALQFILMSYRTVIFSLGLYKETQWTYIIGAFTNLIISVLLVHSFGLVGVAIGTLAGSVYMLIAQGIFVYKKVLEERITVLSFKICKTLLILLIGNLICHFIPLWKYSYLSWMVLAIIHSTIWMSVIVIINLIIDRKRMVSSIKEIRRLRK